MNSLWIDSLAERIVQWERSIAPPTPSHYNRYTAPAVQLKKRLDILWARLRYSKNTSDTYRSPWYVTPEDCRWQIVEDYDKMLTDIYTHLSYLFSLDQYTKTVTHNRGYYCRKRSQTRLYLLNTYFPQTYSMRDQAWERFLTPSTQLHSRPPLNSFLFNYLISLQDGEKK